MQNLQLTLPVPWLVGQQATTPRPKQTGLSQAQLLRLTYQLATALSGGLGLIPSLLVVGASGESHSGEIVSELIAAMEQGQSFSQALGLHPRTFPSSYRRMVESAEQTGELGFCLQRLADTLERHHKIRRSLISATVYPLCLLAAAVALIWAMLWFVLPMILSVTQEAGIEPPWLTRCLMALTRPELLLPLALGSGLLGVGLSRAAPRYQRQFELHTPVGRILTRYRLVTAIRQLALMLEGGVDLLRAIRYSSRVSEQSLSLSSAFEGLYERVVDGEALSASMGQNPEFPHLLVAMVAVAEEVGEMPQMLYRYVELCEEDLIDRIQTASRLLEPLLLLVMGLGIGLILIASFQPIYQLANL